MSSRLEQATRDELERPGYDLVDNCMRSPIWQGVADGRIDDKVAAEPGRAIDGVVRQIFVGFPLSKKD
jgi:hypothetical protein